MNYHFIKPQPEDLIDIEDLNENFDAIDGVLKELDDASAAFSEEVTAASLLQKLKTVDGSGSGLDADRFQGNALIPVAKGGTGASSAAAARANLGITADLIQSLIEGGSISMVKSVQRGVVEAGPRDQSITEWVGGTGTITVNAVNMNKAVVLLGGTVRGNGSPVRLQLTGAAEITWERSYAKAQNSSEVLSGFSWQLIEFY